LFNWNAQEDLLALARREAVLAGEKARLRLELDESEEDVANRNNIRRRLAATLIQIGVRLDPLAAEDVDSPGE
jgi:hypothetical protein